MAVSITYTREIGALQKSESTLAIVKSIVTCAGDKCILTLEAFL